MNTTPEYKKIIAANRASMLLLFGADKYRRVKKNLLSAKKATFIHAYENKLQEISGNPDLSPEQRSQALAQSLKDLHKQGRKKFWFYNQSIPFFRFGRGSKIRHIYRKIKPKLQQKDTKDFSYYLAKTKTSPTNTDVFLIFKNIQKAIDRTHDLYEKRFAIFYGMELAKQCIEPIISKTHHHIATFEQQKPAYIFLKKYSPLEKKDGDTQYLIQAFETQLHGNTTVELIMDNLKNRIHREMHDRRKQGYIPCFTEICQHIGELLNYKETFLTTLVSLWPEYRPFIISQIDKETTYNAMVFHLHELAFFIITELKQSGLWEHMRKHNHDARNSTNFLYNLVHQKKSGSISFNLQMMLEDFERQYAQEFQYPSADRLAEEQIQTLTIMLLENNHTAAKNTLQKFLDPYVNHRQTIASLKKQLEICNDDIGLSMLKKQIKIKKCTLKNKLGDIRNQYEKKIKADRFINPLYQRPLTLKIIDLHFGFQPTTTRRVKAKEILKRYLKKPTKTSVKTRVKPQ